MTKSQKNKDTSWLKEKYREIGPAILICSFVFALAFIFILYSTVIKGIAYNIKEVGPVGHTYAQNHAATFHKLDKSEANSLPDEIQKILGEFDDYYVSSLSLASPKQTRITIYSTSKSIILRGLDARNYGKALSNRFDATRNMYSIGYKPKGRLAKMGRKPFGIDFYSTSENPNRLFHIHRQASSLIIYDIEMDSAPQDPIDIDPLREMLVDLGIHIFCEISDGHFNSVLTSKSFSSTLIGGTSKTACRLVDEDY